MTTKNHMQFLNFSTMCDTIRAVAEQLIPEELYVTLLRIALEKSGASNGYLLVCKDNALQLAADAWSDEKEGVEVRVLPEEPASPPPAGLPAKLLGHVMENQAEVVLADTAEQNPFSEEAQQGEWARSIACLPIRRQGALSGLLYLEHKRLPQVFTAERLSLLKLLAGQAAASLENVRRHAELMKENEKFRKLSEELSLERNLLRTLAESMPHRIYAKDLETRFIFGNMAVAQGMGVSHPDELLGKTDFGFYPPEDAAQYRQEELDIMNSGIPLMHHEEEVDYLLTNDKAYLLTTKVPLRDDNGKVIGIAGINYNITERKKTELELERRNAELLELNAKLSHTQAQLVQSEKLASIGQLAAGVAHEINNPIGYIFSNFNTLNGYLTSLFQVVTAYEEAEKCIDAPDVAARLKALREEADLEFLKDDIPTLMNESKEGISRVRKIVQDLKDFSRVEEQPDWQLTNLHQGIDATLNIINSEIKYKADVIKEYGDIPEVECLSSQINQVVMNLLINAAHAVESAGYGRGKIIIRTGTGVGNAWIEIADTGCGIPKESLPRIFDPFYTTKPVGKGTGLGLSLAYSIMQKHNGSIDVSSEPGRGTTFRITMPVRHVVLEKESKAV